MFLPRSAFKAMPTTEQTVDHNKLWSMFESVRDLACFRAQLEKVLPAAWAMYRPR